MNSFALVFRKIRNVAVLIFFSYFLTSCATLNKTEKPSKFSIRLYPAKKIPFLSPSFLKEDFLSKTWNGQIVAKSGTYQYRISLQADRESIFMQAFSPDNKETARISFSAETLKPSGWSHLPGLKQKDSIALFQWLFYSPEKVAELFESKKLRFTIETASNGKTEIRRVFNKRKCILELTKKSDRIIYRNYEKNIFLTLTESN